MIKKKSIVVGTKEIMQAAVSYLKSGKTVKVEVCGNSMYPLLTDKRDYVVLSQVNPVEIKKNQIVLYVRENEQYVLHRVIRRHGDTLDIRGDAQKVIERDIPISSVQGVVTEIIRKGKRINAESTSLKLYFLLWSMLIPIRGRIIRWIKKA